MSGNRRFVDTNILLYSHDDSAGTKRDQARTLVEQLYSGVRVENPFQPPKTRQA